MGFPFDPISGILSGIGGISNILGLFGIGNKDVPMQNMNPYTDPTMKQFQQLLGESDASFNRMSGGLEGVGNKMGSMESVFQQLADRMNKAPQPGVNEGYNLFNQRSPELLDLAQRMADMFTQPYRETAGETANRRADQTARDIMGQFGGAGYSGAANAAASRGAADVLGDYESNVANMYGQIGSNAANQALGQERGMAEAAPQQRFANMINNLINQGQMHQQRLGAMGQQASALQSLLAEYGARSRGLQGGIAGLSAPQYAEQVQTSPFGDLGGVLGGLGNMFGSTDFQNLFQKNKGTTI